MEGKKLRGYAALLSCYFFLTESVYHDAIAYGVAICGTLFFYADALADDYSGKRI